MVQRAEVYVRGVPGRWRTARELLCEEWDEVACGEAGWGDVDMMGLGEGDWVLVVVDNKVC
jgi:hypothetical protein